jgi:hypothetical protein
MASRFQKCLLTSINLHHECPYFIKETVCSPDEKSSSFRNVVCVKCAVCVFKTMEKKSLYLLAMRFNKYHYPYRTHWNTFLWEYVRRFHQTLKGVHGTIKVKDLNRGFLSGTWCRVVEWSVPDVSRRRISLISKGRNVHWILVDQFRWP